MERIFSSYRLLTNECSFRIKEDEIALITPSITNWIQRKNYTEYREADIHGNYISTKINVVDICLMDLGLNYSPEFAYVHPALVIEKIGDFLIIVPTSTNADKITDAYDFKTKNGKWYYIKVGRANGFHDDCVLMLNNMKSFGIGRVLTRKGKINEDITSETSIFYQVKQLLYENYFPVQFKRHEQVREERAKLEKEARRAKGFISKLQEEHSIILDELASKGGLPQK